MTTTTTITERYYLMIKTEPNKPGWHHPQGWSWDSKEEAVAGARKADGMWMAVRLLDSKTGHEVAWRE